MSIRSIYNNWKVRLGGALTAGALSMSLVCAPAPAQAFDPIVWWGTIVVIDGVETLVMIGLPAGISPTSAAAATTTTFFEFIPLGPAAGGGGAAAGGITAGTIAVEAGVIIIAAVGITLAIDWAINEEPLWEVLDADTITDDDFWDIYFTGTTDIEPIPGASTVACWLDPIERWQACRTVFQDYAVEESFFGDTLCSDIWGDPSRGADDPQMQQCNDLVGDCLDSTAAICDAPPEPPEPPGGDEGGSPDPGGSTGEYDDSMGGTTGGYGDESSDDGSYYGSTGY
ncbi:MAG: hypothetical protein AB1Z98_12990 [Nannocystaceae bacterium]